MTDIALSELSFEAALKELEAVVARLERGEATLDESIALYERGTLLRRHCEEKLRDAEERVAMIQLGEGGRVEGATPVEGL